MLIIVAIPEKPPVDKWFGNKNKSSPIANNISPNIIIKYAYIVFIISSISNIYILLVKPNLFMQFLNIVFYQNIENYINNVAASEATKDTTVICVFIEGPAVSLKGSPTVSPITAAL